MDKLGELLNVLKENKLDKTYNRIMTDLADIKSALSVVNEEVNDVILGLLSEGRYEEVGKLTSIPAKATNIIPIFENILNLNTDVISEKVIQEICDNTKEKVENKKEDILEYSGIITSRKGLKKGAQVMHKIYGIGKVISLEETTNGNGKILRVMFDSCGEKPFNCTPEILLKYFGIEDNGESIEDNGENIEEKERNYDIPENLKGLFSKIETIILRQDIKVTKEKMATYYKYTFRDKAVCTITATNKVLKICFNVPYGKLIDTKGLLEDVSNKGHHGIGPYRLKVDEQTSLADIENFVKQTFNYYKYQ